MRPAPLGVILAGGLSTRYGTPKALAPLAGVRLVDRVRAALEDALGDVIVSANDAAIGEAIGLPWFRDRLAGAGALGGIHAGLHAAAERNAPGIVAVACDMPFLSPALLARLSLGTADDVVIPESTGPRGVEPLCAYYGAGCLPAIEAALARDDRRMIGFHADVRVHRIPLAEVRGFGDPELLFMNVNTPADAARAERLLAAGGEA